jgi:hypothetical protein
VVESSPACRQRERVRKERPAGRRLVGDLPDHLVGAGGSVDEAGKAGDHAVGGDGNASAERLPEDDHVR